MAENIAFKITVDTDVADLSVGELKQAFKDLTQEISETKVGTEKYKQTLTKLGDVKGALKDVKDQINALDPEKKFRAIAQVGSSIASGFAAAQGAVALFGGESEDLQKVLVRVQAATALASGLQGLAGFGKALQTAGLAMRAFAVSNPFTAIAAGIVALVAVIASLVNAYNDANSETAKLEVATESLTTAYKHQESALNDQIKILEAYGDREDEILKKKRELLVINAKEIALQLELAKARKKEADDLSFWDQLRSSFTGTSFIEKRRKEAAEEVKINQDKLNSIKADLTANFIKEDKLYDAQADKRNKLLDELKPIQLIGDSNDDAMFIVPEDATSRIESGNAAIIEGMEDLSSQTSTIRKKNLKEVLADADEQERREEALYQARISIARSGFATIGELALAFQGKSEESQRRAFQINKAASLAGAIVDTYAAANGAYKSQLSVPTPDAPIRAAIAAGIAIASGLARVAVIAKTKFESTDSGGAGSVNAPNLQSPQTSNNQAASFSERGVKANEQGNFAGFDKPMKAYVVESEMTNAQKTINSIAERTTF